MKPRPFIAAVVAAAAVAYGVAHLLSYRPVLLTNRAVWLLNQSRWDEARRQLLEVREKGAQSEQAKRLLAIVSLNTGQYETAAEEIRQLDDSAYRDFLSGACAYVSGRDAEANQAFLSFLSRPPGETEPWMTEVARLAAGEKRELGKGPRTASILSSGRVSPLERMLRSAFMARALYATGRYEESRPFFEIAWSARDRNRETMIKGAATHAILGEYSRAQLYADRVTSRSDFLHAVAGEADRRSSETSAVLSPTIQQAVLADELRLRLGRMKTWCAVTGGAGGGDEAVSRSLAATGEFLKSAPHDLVGKTLRGDALEQAGQLREAYNLYDRAFSENPAYPLLLRIRDLVGNSEVVRRREAEFLREAQVVAYVAAEAMETSRTTAGRGRLAFYERATASAEFELPEDAEYQISLIASGDRAFGLGPVVNLTLDGRRIGDMYIAREGWDVYPRRESLTRGRHRLDIEYSNDSERRLSPEEDRNFYLQGVLITRAGGHEQ